MTETIRGSFDELSRFGASGWAHDMAEPDRRLVACLTMDGEPIGCAVCNEAREDLRGAGIGDGRHAFVISFSTPLDPEAVSRIHLIVEGKDLGRPITTFRRRHFAIPTGLSDPTAQEAGWEDQDFSQHGEQPHILRYFLEHPDAPRYLVDIGAFDGVTGSNSRSLLLRGWSGALVEPDPRTFARMAVLYAERPDVVCVRCAIAGQAGVKQMHFTTGPEFVDPALAWQFSQVNTLVSNIADLVKADHGYRFRSQLVSVATLPGLLDWVHAPAEIGFISIDAEGVDTEIIRSNDFRRHRPWLISVECDDLTRPEMIDALRPSNYSVYARTVSNTLFERKAQK